MNPVEIAAQLTQAMQVQGFRHRIVSADHIGELRERIRDDIANQRIDPSIYRLYQDYFDFKLSDTSAPARSLIVVAAPQPQALVVFTLGGEKLPTIVPPTYHNYTDALVAQTIGSVLTPHGWHFERAILTLKLLAVHSGLAKYGKNNIAYVDGMGSFFRLIAFTTDFPSPDDSWQELQMADRCTTCTACIRKCPTRAIDSHRFNIKAERCLTYHTENLVDFPDWIDNSWHHCLIGCMRCQTCCPLNKEANLQTRVVVEFSEEETGGILKAGLGGLPASDIRPLLQTTGLSEDLQDLVPRNLRTLIDNQKKQPAVS